LLAHGRWFSPGTPATSTTKTGRHDIAEILLKVALNTKNQIKSIIFGFNQMFVPIVKFNPVLRIYQFTNISGTTNLVSSNPAHERCTRYNIM
jgi:hypothetical protein